jgi:anti-anti-sigma factor
MVGRFGDGAAGVPAADPASEISVTSQDGVVLVELVGEHDTAVARRLAAVLRGQSGNVVVSLARTSFIDSSIVAALFVADREISGSGRTMVVHCPSGTHVARVLQIVQAPTVIDVTEALQDAIEHAGRATET